jgi:Flp pilus assembly protein TadG
MTQRRKPGARAGTIAVECAIVLPLTFFFLFAVVIGGMGMFRYQEVATLAREGARFASTHGHQYRRDAGQPVGTADDWSLDVYNNAIAPQVVSLDTSQLSYQVSWPDVINQPGKPDNWPGSKVDVTVSYQWFPELYLIGPITLTSTSSMPITN